MENAVQSFVDLREEEQIFAGGKGGTLARLYQAGYPVPDGFVIMPTAFIGDKLSPEVWSQVQVHMSRMRSGDKNAAFAVRSSALCEDSSQASFAGEFKTVLDIHTDEAIQAAIRAVRRSRWGERAHVYSRAKGVSMVHQGGDHEMAVVVQRMVRADISGVLFTADPVTGSHAKMVGNFVFGFGEELISGEAEPYTFTIERPQGRYDGPSELKRFASNLYKLARRLEEEMGCPQDIEWCITGRKLCLLQSRSITTLIGFNSATGEWNTSLMGDYLWSNANLMEATPDVMTPFTWSIWEIFFTESGITIGNHPVVGNICGRPYGNLSAGLSIYLALGKNTQEALQELGESAGRVPEGLEVPRIPVSRYDVLRILIPAVFYRLRQSRKLTKKMPEFVASSPEQCRTMQRQIEQAQTKAELVSLWNEILNPVYFQAIWMLRIATKLSFNVSIPLHHNLTEMIGVGDANALLSDISGASELASLGPVSGLARVARGEMSRDAYLERYGHRGPHECEFMAPRPIEDPDWLDQQLADYARVPFDVDQMLAKQRSEFDVAWRRFQGRYPDKAKSMKRRLGQAAEAARRREAVRSEFTRIGGVIRAFAMRAGEMTGLNEDVFFLSIDELLEVLSGEDSVVVYIPARRETYTRYVALPPLPAIINGRFDPFMWAEDPERRSDIFDSHTSVILPTGEDAITGFAGAAGRVDGPVRRLDTPEEGDQLLPGEILVTTTTNVGWTPLFPRAAAIVTDVGAPLSHAAIVARELGIPAVVGCGDATMRLRTGDLVRVDGGQGVVEVLDSEG